MFSTSWGRANMHRDHTKDGEGNSKWMSIDVLDTADTENNTADTEKNNIQPSQPQPPKQPPDCSIESIPLPAGEMDMFILPTVIPRDSGRQWEDGQWARTNREPYQYQSPRSAPRPLHQP